MSCGHDCKCSTAEPDSSWNQVSKLIWSNSFAATRSCATHSRSTGITGADFARLSKEYSELSPIVDGIDPLRRARDELASLTDLAQSSEDAELRALAEDELRALRERLPALEQRGDVGAVAEGRRRRAERYPGGPRGHRRRRGGTVRSGTLSHVPKIRRIAGWRFEILDLSETGLGGFREATALISGRDVFARLKFESGVHRVQRVPETEAAGRIHTSAATVAVLPEAEDVDIRIDERDLRIDVFRSSGPGGQSVNTTDSAVRITHIPTGMVVIQQDEKSQHKNKAKALKVLRSRLYDMERRVRDSARAAERKSQVGSGDRSERIRTYNFPQGRVTDHRINLTLYKIDKVMSGEALDEIIDAILAEDQAARLAAVDTR